MQVSGHGTAWMQRVADEVGGRVDLTRTRGLDDYNPQTPEAR